MLIVQLQGLIQLIRAIARQHCKATASGFEPLRAEPNGFRNRTLSASSSAITCCSAIDEWHVGMSLVTAGNRHDQVMPAQTDSHYYLEHEIAIAELGS